MLVSENILLNVYQVTFEVKKTEKNEKRLSAIQWSINMKNVHSSFTWRMVFIVNSLILLCEYI